MSPMPTTTTTLKKSETISVQQHRFAFETLANELRLDILRLLEQGPKNVTQLAEATKAERSRVSHALQILRQCHLVRVRKKGREMLYELNTETPVFKAGTGNIFALMAEHCKQSCTVCKRTGRKPFE